MCVGTYVYANVFAGWLVDLKDFSSFFFLLFFICFYKCALHRLELARQRSKRCASFCFVFKVFGEDYFLFYIVCIWGGDGGMEWEGAVR